MFVDFVMNGEARGEFGQQLQELRFDPGFLRPYREDDGHVCVPINTGKTRYDDEKKKVVAIKETVRVKDLRDNGVDLPVTNATLALRKDDWKIMDRAIMGEARQRLRAWGDLSAANNYSLNGMSKLLLEHETMDDPGAAYVDMDGLTEGTDDDPNIQLEGLPLPITHSGFYIPQRKLAISRTSGQGLDVTKGELAARRVAETVEQTTIGTLAGMNYGVAADYNNAPTVYGYTTHPDRVTKTDLTAPTSSNGTTIVGEVLEMVELLYANKFYGPFMLYVSTGYDAQLDNDLKANSDKTVRQRIREIEAVRDIRRLDYLTGNVMLLVQMTGDVARAVNGMTLQTVQWESHGGMKTNFRVMAIYVPQIRSTYGGNSGICHGTTS